MLFLGLLTSCSPEGLFHPKSTESKENQAEKHTRKNPEIGAPVALPPSFKDSPAPVQPGQTPTVTLPNGLPALQPAKGINVDALFSEELKDENERFDRVENAVLDLRKEFEAYKPSIVRLAAVESDIQNLVKELEVLLQETPADIAPPVGLVPQGHDPTLSVAQLKPEPEHPPEVEPQPPPEKPLTALSKRPEKKPEKIKSLPSRDGIVAENLRAGEHADRVRIVLDTNKKTEFTVDLDNDENLIIIELPNARWIGSHTRTFPDSKLLNNYAVEPLNDGKGSMIILSLKRGTDILLKKRLDPSTENPYHRIYFDLKL